MPNHVMNKLTFSSQEKKVLSFLKGDKELIDFNKIIPMPEELNIESSNIGEEGAKYLFYNNIRGWFEEKQASEAKKLLENHGKLDEGLELGKQYLSNLANHGFYTWYDWRRKNWGTKWNAYESKLVSENCIMFETAWNGVVELIEKLSLKFPNVEFEYSYADEDCGANTGTGTIKNGVSTMNYPESYSIKGYELCFSLRPDYKEYYKLQDGKYVSIEYGE